MEPGEIHCLGTPIVLSAGVYFAKVTVIGSADDADYWMRIVQVLIPTQRTESMENGLSATSEGVRSKGNIGCR
jgi:hypothetical protein